MGRILRQSSSRAIQAALSELVNELDCLYPTTLPPLIDLICWHADAPTFLIKEARMIIERGRSSRAATTESEDE